MARGVQENIDKKKQNKQKQNSSSLGDNECLAQMSW